MLLPTAPLIVAQTPKATLPYYTSYHQSPSRFAYLLHSTAGLLLLRQGIWS